MLLWLPRLTPSAAECRRASAECAPSSPVALLRAAIVCCQSESWPHGTDRQAVVNRRRPGRPTSPTRCRWSDGYAARDRTSGVPDDFADVDAVDRYGGAAWRIRPDHLRPSLRRLFRFEDQHASTAILVHKHPVAGDKSRRLAEPGNALLVQDLLGLLEIVNRGLSDYAVHRCLRSLARPRADAEPLKRLERAAPGGKPAGRGTVVAQTSRKRL